MQDTQHADAHPVAYDATTAGPFDGPGEMRARCRDLDWDATSIGPVERWPAALRGAVQLCLDAGFAMCVFAGPEYAVVYNDAYVATLGSRKHPHALGRPAREVWGEIWPEIAPEFARVRERGVSSRGEHRAFSIERDGSVADTFWTYALSPVREGAGQVVGVHGVFIETTTEVRARAAATQAEQRVAYLAAASAMLAESLDPEAVLRTIARLALGTPESPGLADACTVVLATPEEARSGRWRTVIEGIDPAKVAVELERQRRYPAPPNGARGFPAVIRTGGSELVTPEMMEAQLRAVTGDPEHAAFFDALDLYTAVSAPLVARGRVLGALTLVRHGPARRGGFDAADLALAQELARRAALALDNARLYSTAQQSRTDAESARASAETASRAKSDFLAVMSHELRTPLNAIGGYAELLELGIHGPVTPEQRQALDRIQQSQRHLLGLINQVLNYTRIDAGVVRYDLADVCVAEALGTAEALVLPQVRARGLTYVLGRCAPALAVRADREKLQQILLNLLTNAIKFTEAGGEVAVTCAAAGSHVRVAVRDTGIGIAPEKLGTIFEPFVQVDQRHTRPHDGVGLGLAISRDLARGMGGDLIAESTMGVGSTFTLTLPRA